MDLDLLENLQEKNPKIIAEYFFENYEYHEINKLVKQIQKKIMEKNNSLKLMLSHRYVDLLDCSELIENLKHYSNRMSGIAERNAENIKNSLKFISEKKSAPVKAVEQKKISNIDKALLIQRKALETGNRDVHVASIAEKIYFIVLFLRNSGTVEEIADSQDEYKKKEYIYNLSQLKELLTELFARILSSLNQLVDSTYTLDRKEILISILGIIRGVQYLASDEQMRFSLTEIIEDTLPDGGQELENIPQDGDIRHVLQFSFTLIKKVIQKRFETSRETPAKTLKYLLRIVRDFFWMLSEESDGFVIKKVDEAVQAGIFNSSVFRSMKSEEDQSFEKMPGIFDEESESVIQSTFDSLKDYVQGITPSIETLIKNNSKTNNKFNAEFLSQILWEGEQKDLLNNLKTRYGLDLPQRIEEVFRVEWKNYSEYYIKKIIEDFSIEESFSHILKSIIPYVSKQENTSYRKTLNVEKVNKRLHEAVDIADSHWKKSIAEYDEFWGTFDKNMFQSLAELEHLEEIIADSLSKKVVVIDKDFNQAFFENADINTQKKYVLIIILVNYLELMYQKLSGIMKDLKKKGLFEKLLKSLCDRIYQTIQNDAVKQISDAVVANGKEADENGANNKSLRILSKINKMLLQFQLDNIEHPKYTTRFREYVKQESHKLVSTGREPEGDGHSLAKYLKTAGSSASSTYPLDFFYFIETPELEKIVRDKTHHIGDHKTKKKDKALNIRDTLFLEKLSVDQNEFLNDYTVIPVQKFTLKKRVESVVTRRETRPAGAEPAPTRAEEGPQFAINETLEKAKNKFGEVFKLFKK